MFTHAITRKPGPNFANGLTTSQLGRPDFRRMLEQHAQYVATLKSLGLKVTVLDALPDYPDAYFVEDAAIVTPKIAVITHPGAISRRGEVASIEPALQPYRPIVRIQPPATVEGGDVLMTGNHFFIGISERTNPAGASELAHWLYQAGHTTTLVPVAAGLHLKSEVNYLGQNTLILTEKLAGRPEFKKYRQIVVAAEETYAANTLWINDTLLTPKGFPQTYRQLQALNLPILELATSGAQKMDGGLTCMSLRF